VPHFLEILVSYRQDRSLFQFFIIGCGPISGYSRNLAVSFAIGQLLLLENQLRGKDHLLFSFGMMRNPWRFTSRSPNGFRECSWRSIEFF